VVETLYLSYGATKRALIGKTKLRTTAALISSIR